MRLINESHTRAILGYNKEIDDILMFLTNNYANFQCATICQLLTDDSLQDL